MTIWKRIKNMFTLKERCSHCGRVFDTKKGLMIHTTRVHDA